MSVSINEKEEIYKAINSVSQKVNDVSQKLDEIIFMLNADCNNKISISGDGIEELGVVITTHDEAINELANMIVELEEKVNG